MIALPPLAERMRPSTLDTYVGQRHLVGPNMVLRKSLERGEMPSIILWGPPGVGKTTLARIISKHLSCPFFSLSAVNAGVKEIRDVIHQANQLENGKLVLFIDEIHRFSKSQQDSLLSAVEQGLITLIGATTENPSFEVISALLSRCQIYMLKPLTQNDLMEVLQRAMQQDEHLKELHVVIQEYEALFRLADGDARKLLNTLELVVNASNGRPITNAFVLEQVQQNIALYDKAGEQHYDIISAFIKSIRGSDPNAAVYWLARMIAGGEEPSFIARRLLILAAEDIGNANPNALLLANNCFQAVNVIGWPEARIILSQTAIYLACSAKSNASYTAINKAQALVAKTGNLSVPFHLRNAPTKLMRDEGYGKDYKYAHAYEGNFVEQEFLPDALHNTNLYQPGSNTFEQKMKDRLKTLWKNKYGYE